MELIEIINEARATAKQAHIELSDLVMENYRAFSTSESGHQWKRDQLAACKNKCPVCQVTMGLSNSEIDHKNPRSKYPHLAWDESNLWVICKRCNRYKDDKEWSEFIVGVKQFYGAAAVKRILG